MTTAGFAKLRSDGPVAHTAEIDYAPLVAELRAKFDSGKTKRLAWRRQQLQQIKKMFEENHEAITAAVNADHGGAKMRGVAELGTHMAACEALDNLDDWTKDEVVHTPMMSSPTRMGRSFIRKEAKGVVLIIGPWNFPFELVFHPLVSAIAAGNPVAIKPSEVSTNSSQLAEKLINKYLDTSAIKVVQGAVPETSALLKERWDHIFYTGNGHVGRIVLKAAAEHLTPVTLELGGKSPVIIDKSAKIQTAIERVSAAKWLNVGQICVAPDYVLVHKDREQEFVEGMKKKISKAFGEDPKASPHFGRIINGNHVRRIDGLLHATQGEVVAGGKDAVDADSHYFPPTLVKGAKLGEPLLSEEIFGPVLPIVAVENMDDAVSKVNTICDRPLALYVYSEDQAATDTVLNGTLSGGACVNTSLEHLMNANLPFGGVGGSGYGAYHGKAGFDEFTHYRSVFKQDTTIMKGAAFPDKPPDSAYDIAVKATVTGFLTDQQRSMLQAGKYVVGAVVAGALLRSRL
jgi:aldehyde dehydrogenase (NAD+)